MLWRDLKAWQIYGANTDVGKTIVSTILCKALQRRAPTLYLKPISTGPLDEADDRNIAKHAPGVVSRCLSQFSIPVSPHLAAQIDGSSSKVLKDDKSVVRQTKLELNRQLGKGVRYALLETAGGVLSPGPSGTVQADLYRPLRLPSLLIGDSKLGGIGTSISAFESLYLRGYDVDSVVVFDDPAWGNAGYLREYFAKHKVETTALPLPPPRQADARADEQALDEYYESCVSSVAIGSLIDRLNAKHFSRVSKLTSLPSLAESVIWHPFRQHGIPHNIIAIDSAYKDHFEAYNQETDASVIQQHDSSHLSGISPATASSEPLTTPLFDASASWWTQGLGHGNPDLSLTAAYAAGRYGHVMFAHSVHEPALDLCYNLLSTIQNPRLARVFFTDNGSTGMEVAVKMALRAACQRYGWEKDGGGSDGNNRPVEVLGLKGSYHGDTIGVMNCSEPSVYNEKVDWYKPWGFWFDPPQVLMKDGQWTITIPHSFFMAETESESDQRTLTFPSLASIFDYSSRPSEQASFYKSYIISTLRRLVGQEKRRFGALVLEPIIMGAGGMIFVDPLFQRTLITTIRENPELIGSTPTPEGEKEDRERDRDRSWSGIPFVADEVFTGLYRLGRPSSSSFLSSSSSSSSSSPPTAITPTTVCNDIAPDISVHAKLLTGGLLPLAVTTASQTIFNSFLSESKTDALLHGHSYTAHAMGCAVANRTLDTMREIYSCSSSSSSSSVPLSSASETSTTAPASWKSYRDTWSHHHTHTNANNNNTTQEGVLGQPDVDVFSFFSPAFLSTVSQHPLIQGCWALGSVLAITLNAAQEEGGYSSNATAGLQARLLNAAGRMGEGQTEAEAGGIHSRVLGDVLYIMCSMITEPAEVRSLEKQLMDALNQEMDSEVQV